MNMQVAKNMVVTLDYNVTDPDGELVDAGQEPLVYLHGGYDDIFPMIEEAVQGKNIGESVVVKMQPDRKPNRAAPSPRNWKLACSLKVCRKVPMTTIF